MALNSILAVMARVMATPTVVFTALFSYLRQNRFAPDVRAAARVAFQEKFQELETKLRELADSQTNLEQRTDEVSRALEQSRRLIHMGHLLNLNSRQIEKYQQQTRSRATLSFFVALLAMVAGLGFLVWGGSIVFRADKSILLAAGGIVLAVGGGVSAYITKTFLDIHRVSLDQMNRYFRQPVVNDRILMAQRLADDSEDSRTRQQAYDKIIGSITELIKAETSNTAKLD